MWPVTASDSGAVKGQVPVGAAVAADEEAAGAKPAKMRPWIADNAGRRHGRATTTTNLGSSGATATQ